MVLPLTRVIFYVSDVELLKSFYHEALGLPVVEEIKGEWVVFQAGQTELALHLVGNAYRKPAPVESTEAEPPSRWPTARPNAKIVFTTDGDLAAHREKLVTFGANVQNLKRYDGFAYDMYDGVDPEGNVFQVMRLD